MGSYLNPGNEMFRISRNSQIYVDKSGLIDKMNYIARRIVSTILCEGTVISSGWLFVCT